MRRLALPLAATLLSACAGTDPLLTDPVDVEGPGEAGREDAIADALEDVEDDRDDVEPRDRGGY